jgi:predicted RNA-binding protein Jag
MERLDVNTTPVPRATITNSESAQKWVEELIRDMQVWRMACDVIIPDKNEVAVKAQRRAMWTFLAKHGEVVGALKTLALCGLISDRCYRELNQKAINSLIPTIVGGQ